MSGDHDSAEASAEETVVSPTTLKDEADEPFTPFDEMHEDFQPGPLLFSKDPNGVPTPVDQTTPSPIPPLSTGTLVCMGDFSSFVVRDDYRTVLETFAPAQVTRLPDGRWYVLSTTSHREVEPVRPPCQHYVRQKTQFNATTEAYEIARLCSARRTTEGTFMTVRDVGMYACDMRVPFDMETSRLLDDFDAQKAAEGARRVFLPIALPAPEPPGPGGIFDP